MLEVITPELAAYHQQKLKQFQKENSAQAKGGIVFVGDSITEFFPLKKYLGRELLLINRGIAGTDTDWLVAHLDEQVLDLEPSQIFLMLGVNDIGMGKPVSHIVDNLSEIIGRLRSLRNVALYVLAILPINESSAYADRVKVRRNAVIQDVNERLAMIASDSFVDCYPVLLENQQLATDYTTDGLHLSQKGYQVLAKSLKPLLKES